MTADDKKPKTPQHLGECFHCGKTFAKRSATRHVACCPERPAGRGRVAHLIVESADRPAFYLHIECPPRATLRALDALLRDTWLECCGHLSSFEIDGQRYEDVGGFDDWDMVRAKPLSTRIETALAPGTRFTYEYDFGSTTRLAGRLHRWVERVERRHSSRASWPATGSLESPARAVVQPRSRSARSARAGRSAAHARRRTRTTEAATRRGSSPS